MILLFLSVVKLDVNFKVFGATLTFGAYGEVITLFLKQFRYKTNFCFLIVALFSLFPVIWFVLVGDVDWCILLLPCVT